MRRIVFLTTFILFFISFSFTNLFALNNIPKNGRFIKVKYKKDYELLEFLDDKAIVQDINELIKSKDSDNIIEYIEAMNYYIYNTSIGAFNYLDEMYTYGYNNEEYKQEINDAIIVSFTMVGACELLAQESLTKIIGLEVGSDEFYEFFTDMNIEDIEVLHSLYDCYVEIRKTVGPSLDRMLNSNQFIKNQLKISQMYKNEIVPSILNYMGEY